MANFFKDYQKQVQERRAREQEPARKDKQMQDYFDHLETGDKVQINPRYDWTEKGNGVKYFVMRTGTSLLLADTKREAVERGRGYLYSMYCAIVKGVNA